MKKTQVKRGIVAVRADGTDIKKTIEALNKAFAGYQAEIKSQVDEIKAGINDSGRNEAITKAAADVLALQKQVDELVKTQTSAQMAYGQGDGKPSDPEYLAQFNAHFRTGADISIQTSLKRGVEEDGGYLAPVEWDRTLTSRLHILSPMRSICAQQTVSVAGFSKIYNVGGIDAGWVGETESRPETSASKMKKLDILHHELYANPYATQQMLDDSEINLEKWLAGEVELTFAKKEGQAFLAGDGVNKPHGILTYVEGGANASKHPYGAIQAVKSGVANGLNIDSLLKLAYSLPTAYTNGARFVLNKNSLFEVMRLKDANGNPLWMPSLREGQPSTLLGYSCVEMPDMPDVAANSTPVLFGDFSLSYLIVDRAGIRIVRDPYSAKPYVQFYTTKRVGGGLINPEPMRALKIAAD